MNHRVVSQAAVVAFGVAADRRREILGFDVGDSENDGFWTAFMRSLKNRGLDGVKPVISDAHAGLKSHRHGFPGRSLAALPCPLHAQRALHRPEGLPGDGRLDHPQRVAQPDAGNVNSQFDEVTRMLGKSHPKVAAMLEDAREDVLAFAGFPAKHWRQVWSTNPMERVNKEIKRRTDVVGGSPTWQPFSGSPAWSSSSPAAALT